MATTQGHTRRRSSIDRVIDLLADLEESQIAVLLDDLNHTTSSQVPVSDAIAMFEQHTGKANRSSRSCRSPEPMKTLQAELERRHSKRMSARLSSAPEPRFRSTSRPAEIPPTRSPLVYREDLQQPQLSAFQRSVSSPLTPGPEPRIRPTIAAAADADISVAATQPAAPTIPADLPTPTLTPPIEPATIATAFPSAAKTTAEAPLPLERPPSPPPASLPAQAPAPRPRSYKRISRPVCLSPTATAELHTLLLAFFNETPTASTFATTATATATTTATVTTPSSTMSTPSPTTPHFSGFPPPLSLLASSHSPFPFVRQDDLDVDDDPERTLLGLDLLEPPPTLFPAAKMPAPAVAATPATAKTPDFVVSRGKGLKPMPSIGSMFEAFGM
ncbi:hypothetical protein VTJ83DRAFT_1877 [Remersonia thermophila]|uniref:Uncharacterized protein n=1 Tax=Remersonia thermophila TaxID=72144 RepID=A0ABR4DH63_9PEZI